MNQKKRKWNSKIAAIVITLGIVCSFTACATEDKSSLSFPDNNVPMNSENVKPEFESLDNTNLNHNNAINEDQKIIHTVHLDMETENSLDLYQKLNSWIEKNNGYEFFKNQYKSGDATVIESTLKIAPECLTEFLNFAGQSGTIINSQIDTENITEEYYDIQTRLTSKEKALERYYKLLEKAQTVDEILVVQNQIDQITEEIESVKGRLNFWDNQVQFSTIYLVIREYKDPVKIKKELHWNTMTIDDVFYLMKRGLFNVTNVIVSVLQWLLIVVVSMLPILVILGIIVIIIVFCTKQHKKKKQQLNKNNECINQTNNHEITNDLPNKSKK